MLDLFRLLQAEEWQNSTPNEFEVFFLLASKIYLDLFQERLRKSFGFPNDFLNRGQRYKISLLFCVNRRAGKEFWWLLYLTIHVYCLPLFTYIGVVELGSIRVGCVWELVWLLMFGPLLQPPYGGHGARRRL